MKSSWIQSKHSVLDMSNNLSNRGTSPISIKSICVPVAAVVSQLCFTLALLTLAVSIVGLYYKEKVYDFLDKHEYVIIYYYPNYYDYYKHLKGGYYLLIVFLIVFSLLELIRYFINIFVLFCDKKNNDQLSRDEQPSLGISLLHDHNNSNSIESGGSKT